MGNCEMLIGADIAPSSHCRQMMCPWIGCGAFWPSTGALGAGVHMSVAALKTTLLNLFDAGCKDLSVS